MPLHMLAWSQSVDTSGALTNINVVTEQIVQNPSATRFQVPRLNRIAGIYANGPSITNLRLDAPSTRELAINDFEPLDVVGSGTASPTTPSTWIELVNLHDNRDDSLALEVGEQLGMLTAESGVGASRMRVGALLFDKIIPRPTPTAESINVASDSPGAIQRIRFTGTTTLTAESWTTVGLTADNGLKVGWYAYGGGLARSATLQFWRLIGQFGAWRPGGVGNAAVSNIPPRALRNFAMGTWGVFHSTQLPSMECIAGAGDTAEVLDLDCIYLGRETPTDIIQALSASPTGANA